MNFHQLRTLRETVRHHFSLTRAADAMSTTQPTLSKNIAELERELGFSVFDRRGKRLLGLTEQGKQVFKSAERILGEADTLLDIGNNFGTEDTGRLTIATTHTQARYFLPKAVAAFALQYPKVKLLILQGTPQQIGQWLENGQADIGIATEGLAKFNTLITLPVYRWEHSVIAPKQHALFKSTELLSLKLLARHPLVTYDTAFAGRAQIDNAFANEAIRPDVVLEAIDADVIKTYVEIGLGVGIVASMAFDAARDTGLSALPAGHLFGSHLTRVGVRKNAVLRGYTYTFIQLLAPELTRHKLDSALETL